MKAKHSLFLLFLSAILLSLGHTPCASEAADSARARVTAGINLRAAPGLAGKVITSLEAGTVVAITGEQSGWYQITYEDETYGYRGWVYGKYIEKLSAGSAIPAASATGAPKHAPAQAIATVPEPEPASEQQTAAADRLPQPVDMPTNTIELIQAASAPVQNPTPPDAATGALPPPASETEDRVQAPPAKSVSEIAAPTASGRVPTTQPVASNLLSVILKISSVFLSCLALMISYRTFQLVTTRNQLA